MIVTGWVETKSELPDPENLGDEGRVLVYSPCYAGREMEFRIVDGRFVHIFSEVTHWARLVPPD